MNQLNLQLIDSEYRKGWIYQLFAPAANLFFLPENGTKFNIPPKYYEVQYLEFEQFGIKLHLEETFTVDVYKLCIDFSFYYNDTRTIYQLKEFILAVAYPIIKDNFGLLKYSVGNEEFNDKDYDAQWHNASRIHYITFSFDCMYFTEDKINTLINFIYEP